MEDTTIAAYLGEGTWGSVTLCNYLDEHGKPMACKRSHDVHGSLRHEMALMAGIHHPNVVTFYRYFEFHGYGHIIMEAGCLSLRHLQFYHPVVASDHTEAFILPILEALRFLHDEMLVAHRDVTSDNIVLFGEPPLSFCNMTPKLVDFNLATIFPDPWTPMHVTHGGCPWSHLPPEAFVQPTYDAFAADAWALGVTAFELRYGRFPALWARSDDPTFRYAMLAQNLGISLYDSWMYAHPDLEYRPEPFDIFTLGPLLRIKNRSPLRHIPTF